METAKPVEKGEGESRHLLVVCRIGIIGLAVLMTNRHRRILLCFPMSLISPLPLSL